MSAPAELLSSPLSPRISIGMPVYNGGRYLRGALEALLRQTLNDFELILSDNASGDDTELICRETLSRDGRVRYIRQPKQLDLQANFNFVLAEARAPLFMWAAHDDLWDPTFLECLVGALEANPRAILAFAQWENVREDGSPSRDFVPIDWGEVFSGSKTRQLATFALTDGGRTQKGNHVYGVIRTEPLRKVGGMPHAPVSRGGGEDIHLLLRLLIEGDFEIVKEVLFHYRTRNLPARPSAPLLPYIWRRIAGRTDGHSGNATMAFRGKHFDHAVRRRIVLREAPIPFVARVGIWGKLWIAELRMLFLEMPLEAWRQLRKTRERD